MQHVRTLGHRTGLGLVRWWIVRHCFVTTVKMVSGPRHATDTATQAAPVTTTPSSITVQWKHYLRQLYLELSRYLELDKLDIRCKNPALHYTVLAALTGSSVRCWADPTIIWLGIQNILICDTISSSQQSAGEGWCTGCRYRVSTLHSALGGLVWRT